MLDAAAPVLPDGERAWQDRMSPIFKAVKDRLAGDAFRGTRVCLWSVVSLNGIPLVEALREAGADVVFGASHPQTTDESVASYLRARGVTVLARRGASRDEQRAFVAEAVRLRPDYVLSSGGAALLACHEAGVSPRGALEGTKTGANRLEGVQLRFPVFDWNGSVLKNQIQHRFHVAESLWSAFNYLTGMSLFGRTVLVIGYGPVGKGIAERAAKLGGRVLVVDQSHLRAADALFHGHEVASLEQGIRNSDIVITVTGRDRVLSAEHYHAARNGTIFMNAGHAALELSIDWIEQQGLTRLRPQVERFEVEGRELLLLCHGDAPNLASGAGPFGNDIWDIFSTLILRGAHWLRHEMPADTPPGIHPYPLHIQEDLARLLVACRRHGVAGRDASGRAA
jgi:adenosylhomocysteinase